MLNSETPDQDDQAKVERIVAAGPLGALVLAGTTTAIVIAIWLIFYLVVFMPRAAAP